MPLTDQGRYREMSLESGQPAFKVNFMVMGTQKGGTSALFYFLAQHPEICVQCKEIHLFDAVDFGLSCNHEAINDKYRCFFHNYIGQKLVGEATPIYMYLPFIAERIYRYNPEMKMIFLLRNPIERAISQYQMAIQSKKEWLPIYWAMRIERLRLLRDKRNYSFESSLRRHSYIDRGLYTKQIKNLLKYFSREQMLFIKTDDLLNRHAEVLLKVYEFLGVDEKTLIPIQQKVHTLNYLKPATPALTRFLSKKFESEIDSLEKLLSWDLGEWKRTNNNA